MAKSVKLKETDTYIATEGIYDFESKMTQEEINTEFFRLKPTNISDLFNVEVSGIKFADGGANFAFKIGTYMLFNANINVEISKLFSIPINAIYKPKYNTRISSNTQKSCSIMPFASRTDCAINSSGTVAEGQWHLFGIYELENP